jgi:tryptophanyl-tRNA synthetase
MTGIDPNKSKIFIQSHVPAHTELSWLLSCITPIGWLQRMTQYKDKAAKQQDASDASMGLFGYPVLMAADILLYNTDLVPVGEDQLQHLELARDIAKRFNHKYCKRSSEKVFRSPRAQVVARGARVMSLQDGSAKMSKSAPDDFSRINLLDQPDLIAAKIKRSKTDLLPVKYDCPDRPECANLIGIYEAVTGLPAETIRAEIDGMNWGTFKPLLTDALIAHLKPIQERYNEIVSDPAGLEGVLTGGAEAASAVAEQTLREVKKHIGFSFPRDRLDLRVRTETK